MLKTLEQRWSLISILLLFILLISFLFWPALAGTLAVAALILSLGMAVLFILRRQMKAYRAGSVRRARMFVNIFLEVTGLVLTIALAAFLAQRAARTIAPLAGGGTLGTLITMAAAVIAGIGTAWLVRVIWGKLIQRRIIQKIDAKIE